MFTTNPDEYVSLIYRSLSLPIIDGYKSNQNDDDYSSASMYLSQLPKRSTLMSNGYAVSYLTDINTISKTHSHPEGIDKINYKKADLNLKRAVKTRTLVNGSIAKNSRTTSLDMKKDILGGVSFVKDGSILESGKKIEMISEYPSNESATERSNIPRYTMDTFSVEESVALQNNMSDCKGGVNFRISYIISSSLESIPTDMNLVKRIVVSKKLYAAILPQCFD